MQLKLKKVSFSRLSGRKKGSKSAQNNQNNGIIHDKTENGHKNKKHCNYTDDDPLYTNLRDKAIELTKTEPALTGLLSRSVLHPEATNFNVIVSRAVGARLSSSCGNNPVLCGEKIADMILEAMDSDDLEFGSTMSDAVRKDLKACVRRDPACESELEVLLFFKGFASLVCHRAARRYYCTPDEKKSQRYVSLWLQSQASAAFGVDIHPAAEIGHGVLLDHATGVVIGETAKIGHNCTILHGVTLGGTGKESGDRHPKVGNDVLIGAGSKILGNITIGDGAKIGAGSIVLKPIPHGCTAVGAPAKIIGWANEKKPGSNLDSSLKDIVPISIDTFEDSDNSDESATDTESKTTEPFSDESLHTNGPSIDTRNEKDGQDGAETIDNAYVKRGIDEEDDDVEAIFLSDMCIFPSIKCKKLPMGAANYRLLSLHLSKECSEAEIGEVYMDLLKNNKDTKYIPKSIVSKRLKSALKKYTKLSDERCERLKMGILTRRSSLVECPENDHKVDTVHDNAINS